MANFDLVKLALKATCPGNEVLLDDKGLPSVMVRIPKFKISDVITGGSSSTHPAFIVNGTEVPEIYISKFQNVVSNGRAYSLPGEDPGNSITFDTARAACESKGAGWHIMTNAEWAAIALWCRKNSLMPKGNNSYGKDTSESTVVAIPSFYDGANIGRVRTGTGPVTWSHNGEVTGIWDLNGNVYEWMGGYRTVAGEIQILANNNAADLDNSQAADSTQWMALLEDGTLVAPGTANTLKWDYPATNIITLSKTITVQADASRGTEFKSLAKAADVTAVPEILKALGLYPADTGDHGGDYFYMNNGVGLERLVFRGGFWINTGAAGVFYANGNTSRANANTYIGFRSAFIPGI
ncbi:MAG: SUMF1/EgtB/PvdO family nonheme iron enzyme [Oscillospiraceae bacterium]|nr:SUMF1/EgtB/PvdO family nonheme iron enzyme [Oscillospiraceae bacterium]